MRETRMNTASLCHFVFLCVCLYSFALGNGMSASRDSCRQVLNLTLRAGGDTFWQLLSGLFGHFSMSPSTSLS